MKSIINPERIYKSAVLFLGLLLPTLTYGQTVQIQGDDTVCLGNITSYTLSPALSGYNTNWQVNPNPNGEGTVVWSNNNRANINWTQTGSAMIKFRAVNPITQNIITDSFSVYIAGIPAPFITTHHRLACQPLYHDSLIGAEGKNPHPPHFDSASCLWVCANGADSFFANGLDTGVTYTWSAYGATNVSPATENATVITWGSPGYGSVTLVATNVAGCKDSVTKCVRIIEGPQAKFNIVGYPSLGAGQTITICDSGIVVLTDASTNPPPGQIVSWHWDFGDGSTSNQSPGALNNPITHQYTQPGDYIITLTVTNSCGCSDTYSVPIHVSTGIAPKIACPRVVCENDIITYKIDKACDNGSWGVIGGTIVSASPSQVKIKWNNVNNTTGFGYVIYHSSCNGCHMAVVVPVPVVLTNAVIQGPTNVCAGQHYVYRLPRWPTTDFNWSVSGNGTIQHTDQPNEIVVTAGAGGGSITLSCNYHNTLFKWGGEFSCWGNSSLNISIKPNIQIEGPQSLCLNSQASFHLGNGVAGNWVLTDPNHNTITYTGGTFTSTFTLPGIYRLSVTGNSFCPPKDLLIRVEDKPDKPDYIHGPDSACTFIPFSYTAGAPEPGTTFGWAVSNGAVNAGYGNQSYITFFGPPPYTIKVWRMTTDSLHCTSDTLYKTVYGAVPPLEIIGDDTVCSSTTHHYSLNYQDGDLYRWRIIPNTLGSVVQNNHSYNPKVLWNVPTGTQTALLVCRVRKCLNYYYDTLEVFIHGAPQINITTNEDTVCSGTPITFTVNSNYPINSVGSVDWDWGDGPQSFSTFTNPYVHTYNIQGSHQPVRFTPSVTLTDPNGCHLQVSATLSHPVTILPPPTAFITPVGSLLHCDSIQSPGYTLTTPMVTGYWPSWDYDWQSSNPGQTPPPSTSNTWPNLTQDGSYFVVVSGPAPFNCSSKSNTVKIATDCPDTSSPCDPGIKPAISLQETVNDCGHIILTATVTGGTQVGYQWHYPGNATVNNHTNTTLDVTLPAAGIYTFNYTCQYLNFNNDTCAEDKSISVVVPYLPDLRYSIVCAAGRNGYKVYLYDHSQIFVPGATRHFYRGSTSNPPIGTNVLKDSVIVPGNATYTFYETIQGGGYAECVSSVQVTLPKTPHASFTVTAPYMPGCINDVVFTFHDHSTPTPLSQLTHWWSFNNHSFNARQGDVERVFSVPHLPGETTLIVTDPYGCSDTAKQLVRVRDNKIDDGHPRLKPTPPAPHCQGQIVTLKYINPANPSSLPALYTWYLGQTALTPPIPNPTYQVTTSGGYWALGTDQFGCRVSTPMEPVVFNTVPQPIISGGRQHCINRPFTLHTPSIPGAQYQWFVNGTVLPSTSAYLTYTAHNPGVYTFRVVLFYNGCKAVSSPFKVTIGGPSPVPVIDFDVMSCNPYQIELVANPSVPFGLGTYNWNNGMTGQHIFVNHGGPYQVIYTNPFGCKSDTSIWVPKDPKSYLWIFPTGCFCLTGTPPPSGGGFLTGTLIPFYHWAWLQDGLVDVQGYHTPAPAYTPTPGHIYNLVLANRYCTDTSGNMYYDTDTCDLSLRRPGGEGIGNRINNTPSEVLIPDHQPALLLAPNPAKNSTTAYYRFGDFFGGKGTLAVYDVQGRLLRTYHLSARRGQQRIALSGLSAGLYRVVLETKGRIIRRAKLSMKR